LIKQTNTKNREEEEEEDTSTTGLSQDIGAFLQPLSQNGGGGRLGDGSRP